MTTTAERHALGRDALLPPLTPRQELVLLARALWRIGYRDGLAGHITILQDDGTLLCNPWPLLWSEFGPDDVIRIDLDGKVVEGDWDAPNGIPLHLELHRARSDVKVAMHNHSEYGTVWANAGRVPPMHDQTSAYYRGEVVLVSEYGGPVDDRVSAAATVAAMGDAEVILLANHGVFILGDSIRAVHLRGVALEHRCEMAWKLAAMGGGTVLPEIVLEQMRARPQLNFPGYWEAAARQELRADPSILGEL